MKASSYLCIKCIYFVIVSNSSMKSGSIRTASKNSTLGRPDLESTFVQVLKLLLGIGQVNVSGIKVYRTLQKCSRRYRTKGLLVKFGMRSFT